MLAFALQKQLEKKKSILFISKCWKILIRKISQIYARKKKSKIITIYFLKNLKRKH
jgi:hypothetical protein